MSEPSLALTFDDFCMRVSEVLGVAYYGASGTSAAAAPTDTHDLDLVKRLVNDGWRRFVTSHPRSHWEWQTPVIALAFDSAGTAEHTVAGSNDGIPRAARYYMPDGFYGDLLSPFTYSTTGPGGQITRASEQDIRRMFSGGTSTGDPEYFAVRPVPTEVSTSDSTRKWEVIFYPAPSSDESVYARVRLFPNRMIQTTDRHAAGFQFDNAVLAACRAEAEIQRNGVPGVYAMEWEKELQKALAMDARTGQKKLGYNGDWSDMRVTRTRPYDGVSTYGGVSVTD